jgi:hypothetical protein
VTAGVTLLDCIVVLLCGTGLNWGQGSGNVQGGHSVEQLNDFQFICVEI